MASIAELLISDVQETTKESGRRTQQSIQSAAELALKAEALQSQKAQVAQAKQDLLFKKLEMVDKDINKLQKLPPRARKIYAESYLPNKMQAAGIGPDVVNPTVFKMMIENADEYAIGIGEAKLQMAEGTLTPMQMKQFAQDPEFYAELLPQLVTAQKERLDREAKVEAQQLNIQGQERRQQTGIAATRQEAVRKEQAAPIVALNKDFAKQAQKFKAGGSLGAIKNFKRIEGAIEKLNGPKELSSRVILGNLPFGLADAALETFTPETAAVRDEIRGAIQGTLRETLGAQFTEQEGKAIFNRAYNPIFSDKENARRAGIELDFLKKQVEAMREAVDYFDKNKTIEGFKGDVMSGELAKESIAKGPDFSSGQTLKVGGRDADTGQLAEALRKAKNPSKFMQDLQKASGKSEDELRKLLNLGGK